MTTQLTMTTIEAQLMLDDLTQQINQQIDWYARLETDWNQWTGREQLICEATIGAYRQSMEIVAKHAGITIQWGNTWTKRK